jgi:hypothetical protein
MPYKVKVFQYIEPHDDPLYEDKEEAQSEADHVMFMQPGEVIASVVECDDDGEEV